MKKYIEAYDLEWILGSTGYYRLRTDSACYLHRYVWEMHHGKIPKGYEIHHRDSNKLNNDINNLDCLKADYHRRLTWREMYDVQVKNVRKNMQKALEWRSANKGSIFMHEKNKKGWLKREPKDCICQRCGNSYKSRLSKTSMYCSRKCKSAVHREKVKNGQKLSESNRERWLNCKAEKCICQRCGSSFESKLAKLAKFCSRLCKEAFYRETSKSRVGAPEMSVYT